MVDVTPWIVPVKSACNAAARLSNSELIAVLNQAQAGGWSYGTVAGAPNVVTAANLPTLDINGSGLPFTGTAAGSLITWLRSTSPASRLTRTEMLTLLAVLLPLVPSQCISGAAGTLTEPTP
jgi:hypothetical protein